MTVAANEVGSKPVQTSNSLTRSALLQTFPTKERKKRNHESVNAADLGNMTDLQKNIENEISRESSDTKNLVGVYQED